MKRPTAEDAHRARKVLGEVMDTLARSTGLVLLAGCVTTFALVLLGYTPTEAVIVVVPLVVAYTMVIGGSIVALVSLGMLVMAVASLCDRAHPGGR